MVKVNNIHHLRRKTIIVTGGAGFLGSNLCETLLEQADAQIFCIDNLFTGQLNNIKHLLKQPQFNFIEHDIRKPLHIKNKIDEIYNLACPASPDKYQADPLLTLNTNVIGTLNLLELAKQKKAKFLQTSTSEVYGDPEIHPQKESYWGNVNTVGIRSCYDEGKRCAETYCYEFNRQYQVQTKIVRIFNTYGPKMDIHDGRVVSNFIYQALLNKPITIYGDGSQTRSLCYVNDLVQGLIAMMGSDAKITGPINLGNPCELTINEIADIVIKLTLSKSKKVYKTLPSDDPRKRKPDISQAQQLLHWQPDTPLNKGLQNTIRYFNVCLNQKTLKPKRIYGLSS